jgi:hypothetical protein
MNLRFSLSIGLALLIALVGSTMAFGDSGQGRTPDYAYRWGNNFAGSASKDVSGVSGAVPMASASASDNPLAQRSTDVDILLSPTDLVGAAQKSTTADGYVNDNPSLYAP